MNKKIVVGGGKLSEIKVLGNQLFLEFEGVEFELLNNEKLIEEVMRKAALQAGATIIKVVTYKFSPYGVTTAVIVSESSLIIHTWPEDGYASIDIYLCGEKVAIIKVREVLEAYFKPLAVRESAMVRGPQLPKT